jgi:hypothetical protein
MLIFEITQVQLAGFEFEFGFSRRHAAVVTVTLLSGRVPVGLLILPYSLLFISGLAMDLWKEKVVSL